MATSGLYTFSMTRDDIIKAALRLTTRYSSDDVIPAEDMGFCAQALNILCKALARKSLPLWCVQEVAIPMVPGQITYNISLASGLPRPLRVLSASLLSAAGNETPVQLIAFSDYNSITSKHAAGRPIQVVYDAQLSAATIRVYNAPTDLTDTLQVIVQRPVQDFNLATDNPDFPQEAFQMLKWALADEISLEYSTPRDIRMEIKGKAIALVGDFADDVGDEVSVTFTPSGRTS